MLKSKTMMNLLGIFVAAAVVWALLNLWYVPTFGKFSCSYTPWFVAEAQADTGHSCPAGVREAMNDPEWAAEQYKEIAKAHDTTGLYYDANSKRHKIASGDEKGADAERARTVLREVGAPSAANGFYPAASHVEVKVAAIMRETGHRLGVVVINHEEGPCPGRGLGFSCSEVLPLVLATGAILRVWYPDQDAMKFQDFTGR